MGQLFTSVGQSIYRRPSLRHLYFSFSQENLAAFSVILFLSSTVETVKAGAALGEHALIPGTAEYTYCADHSQRASHHSLGAR